MSERKQREQRRRLIEATREDRLIGALGTPREKQVFREEKRRLSRLIRKRRKKRER
jgi:hypothetical protein